MYAVIETGGKQYRVEVGTELEVETLDAEPGQAITLDRVLLVADGDEAAIGRPLVADAAVHAEVVRRDRGEKLIVFKYRPKARTRVKKGHRQNHTILRITDVRLGTRSAAEAVRKAEREATSDRQRLEEAAARQAAADAALAAKLAGKAEPKKAQPKSTAKADTKGAAETKTAAGAKAAKSKPAVRATAKPAAKGKAGAKSAGSPRQSTASKPKAGRTRKDT
jgi:large subunit ribosomal protein L21